MAHFHKGGGDTIRQNWTRYGPGQHDRWRRLYRRMGKTLPDRACLEFLGGLEELDMSDGIPDFRDINTILSKKTGWTVVGVAGLVSDADFFKYLAKRQFPSTCFLREESQFDYIVEPDIFHDGFGHLPMLMNPVIADFVQAYGVGGLKVWQDPIRLKQLARLYWYTIEFGLTQTADGLRIYGSGITSSALESVYALESDTPRRVDFNLIRVMRTDYKIDDLQAGYFVIPSIPDLIHVAMQDFEEIYTRLASAQVIAPGVVLDNEILISPNVTRVA